jgi:chemotaxis protein CheZ
MHAARKTFTIEQSVPQEMLPALVPAATSDSTLSGPALQHVLDRLDRFEHMLMPTQAIVNNIADAYRKEVVEVTKMRDEMAAIQEAINETKRQVITLHSTHAKTVTMSAASGELGAVVNATEGATNAILAAAERVEMLAGVLQSETTMDAMKVRAGEIANLVMTIYESCNFQDLTGQRISRVCETLTFVEGRVNRMAEVWGGLDNLSHIMASEIEALQQEHEALGTHALAAGPALVGAEDHVGQDDIDALFD